MKLRARAWLLVKAAAYALAATLTVRLLCRIVYPMVSGPGSQLDWLLVAGLVGAVSAVSVNLVLGRLLSPPSVWAGWKPPLAGLGSFLAGAGLGILMAGAVLLALLAAGWATLSRFGSWSGYLQGLLFPMLALLPASLWEELLFRGYPLSAISGAAGRTVATFLTAALFGLAHRMAGPYPLGAPNIFLIGLVLARLRLGPGGLPAAWGAHFAWNATLLAVGAPISGLELSPAGLSYEAFGPEWLTGAGFGPEAGLVTTVAALSAALLIWRLQVLPRNRPVGGPDHGLLSTGPVE